jgi:hypothetical protein
VPPQVSSTSSGCAAMARRSRCKGMASRLREMGFYTEVRKGQTF